MKNAFAPALSVSSLVVLIVLLASMLASVAEPPRVQPIEPTELDRLLKIIKPQPGESPWREIDWLTDVTEARERAVAEDKPLVIFTAADGSPLGRT